MRQAVLFSRLAFALLATTSSYAQTPTSGTDIIARLKPNASLAKFRSRLLSIGVHRIEGLVPELRIVRLRNVSLPAARQLGADAAIDWLEPDLDVELTCAASVESFKKAPDLAPTKASAKESSREASRRLPADAFISDQASGLRRVGAPSAWERTTGSSAVRVAILGAGIALEHPDLSSNIAVSPLLRADATGDGTLAAGVIGAVGDNGVGIAGLAWRVTLDPIGILTPAGNGKVSTVLLALRQAVKRGVSIGLLAFQSSRYSRGLRETLKWTIEKGLLLVVPSGDRFGSDNDTSPVYPASYVLPGLVSVAGLDAYGEALSDTTNFGRGGVELAAPGEEVLTTDREGGYARASGSLLAASHVAGAAALLLSRESGLAPIRAHERLLRSAKPMKSLDGKVRSGATLDLSHLFEPSEN